MTIEDYFAGQVLLIDKPLNWTSFQVVNKIRWEIRQAFNVKKIKVGHAGTLDPLATGLLIICTGKMTKQIATFQGQKKEYTGVITIGQTTPSYDLETEVNQTFPTDHVTQDLVEETARQFIGETNQFPPIFSAVKHHGKRLYEFARAGEHIEIKSRKVTIYDFEILEYVNKNIDFRVACSKGTYIRSLAHDLGKALNSGAYLSKLHRTKIGDYNVESAMTVDAFINNLKQSL
ncbi:tRNA pseudouridine(55) synthase TruB [Flavobacteriaceae bacterium]|jgi:tRNA pseudouridine55 synthase|nr:tRNA pseudouridine(55) synthase TruB [Flavobacteriaceae bacterium]